MSRASAIWALAGALAFTGCVSQAQFLQSKQDAALSTGLERGRFELACPDATGTVLSSEVMQPALQGPWVQGVQRAEFTIGVAGCGKRTTFVLICPDGGDGCFAANQGGFLGER